MKMIVAVDENWNIGNEGKLLCHLPGDLKFFKKKTTGKAVVMGRKTLESLPGGKPLPDRKNIVITGDENFTKEGCRIVHSLQEVLDLRDELGDDQMMIMGGASVYKELLPYCDTCYITKIHERFQADVSIPNLDNLEGYIIKMHSGMQEENGIKYQFLEYRKI